MLFRSALMEATTAYKADIIKILVENGANINAQDSRGCTALMRAAYIGFPELVTFLIDNGADKALKDYSGNMAIHYVRKECLDDLKDTLK